VTPVDIALIAALQALTPKVGSNVTEWPGLTAYRFTSPQPPQWAEVHSLALCCVIQGRKRFIVEGHEHVCASGHYLLLTPGMRFQAEILEASVGAPYLSFVLRIEPALVSSVLADMVERQTASASRSTQQAVAAAVHLSPVDRDLEGVMLRFLRSLAGAEDRRVLTPMYLREITYRLMQPGQVPRLVDAAASERGWSRVSEVMRYIREHMAEPLTVSDMAKHALMSPSALTAVFVETTGKGPYQFAKRMRLNRARALLIESELTVSQIVREVGYTSQSYFINEFKRQFGTTPGTYAKVQRQTVAMRVEEATGRAA
jgi:AraC-like DNA-binding protein